MGQQYGCPSYVEKNAALDVCAHLKGHENGLFRQRIFSPVNIMYFFSKFQKDVVTVDSAQIGRKNKRCTLSPQMKQTNA